MFDTPHQLTNLIKYNNWRIDLKDSIKALEKIKNHELTKLISGKIYNIENTNNDILILMDNLSGIDYVRKNDNGLQGIASRVQFGHSFNTFTIRKERHTGSQTEYEKRKNQIKNGYFYPTFTLQAYFDNRVNLNLLSIAVIRTIDLYNYIEKYPQNVFTRKSDNEFIYVNWNNIEHLIKKIINDKINT